MDLGSRILDLRSACGGAVLIKSIERSDALNPQSAIQNLKLAQSEI
ncbi:hypothetical protein D1AOALGA4SA_9807 [Olavius algarvensis Delta 1 endosymbiont]|nr:hypothetical protein D1AOALGA4SA_9807 [Olavius algarvensis Delta 1 endosymbiont]